MTLFDYKRAQELQAPFVALVMAVFMEADNSVSAFSFEKLKEAFPEIYKEIDVRYHAPGGLLLGERDPESGLSHTAEGLVDDDGTLVVSH